MYVIGDEIILKNPYKSILRGKIVSIRDDFLILHPIDNKCKFLSVKVMMNKNKAKVLIKLDNILQFNDISITNESQLNSVVDNLKIDAPIPDFEEEYEEKLEYDT